MSARNVLLLGVRDSGKTTLLVQLQGRIDAARGHLRSRGAPRTLGPIEAGLKRLQQGLAVEHTPKRTEVELDLPAQTVGGQALDIALPDYAGEDLEALMRLRRLPEHWRELARNADRWLVVVRLSKHLDLPDIVSKPIGDLAQASAAEPVEDEPLDVLPIDMWAVELLQVLTYARQRKDGAEHKPSLGLVLSCWDELNISEDTVPSALAAEKLALLHAYCQANWTVSEYAVYGVSAQGRMLDKTTPDEEFLDKGPQAMGWLVQPDGSRTDDLTLLTLP